MYTEDKIHEIVQATLAADAYSLGAHWVYDEAQLRDLPIDWEVLNAPQAMWHEGKQAGDFTHIGDQALWGYEYFQTIGYFDKEAFLNFWLEKMETYAGYIDGATRETRENVKQGKRLGSDSHDFSVIGRIPPLLFINQNADIFVDNAKTFAAVTHNNGFVLEATAFFAKLLLEVEDETIYEAILKLQRSSSPRIREMIDAGFASKERSTFESIRQFGPACGVEEGFSGIIHLLIKYHDLKSMLIANAKAGGDSASRAMVATMIFVAQHDASTMPTEWYPKRVGS